MGTVLFCGCSYVSGSGFAQEKQEHGLWVNLLHRTACFKHLDLINASKGGRSNQGIFSDAVWNLLTNRHDYAFISWTSVPRYEMELGLETYYTRQVFTPNLRFTYDRHLNDIVYDRNYLQKINDRFTSLAHPHYEIVQLLFYVNSLVRLANIVGTKIFFINSICPWDANYFNCVENALPIRYTDFTKKILNVNSRSDDEIVEIYTKMHSEYRSTGGIQEQHWLNLYKSLKSLQVDVNGDGIHPGARSNQIFSDMLLCSLQDRLEI